MDEECGCRAHHREHGDYCGCGMHEYWYGYRRRFLTKAEKIKKLKNYVEELREELKAVEEKIKEMQS